MRGVLADLINMAKRQEKFNQVRVYYGTEFCQTLLPNPNALDEAYKTSTKEGLGFTFVTPSVNDKGLRKLEVLFAFLAKQNAGIEVVVNDWGVLRLLSQDNSHLKPVFGRLMNKMLRDPRVTPRYKTEDAPEEALLALQQSGITSSHYHQLLKSFGIDRIELDNLYQEIEIDFKAMSLRPSIYVPYGYVTTGRVCMFGALNQPKEKKFTSSTVCRKECRKYIATMVDSSYQINGRRLLYTGNTIFYQQDEKMIEKALIWAEEHDARIVYQPSPFGEMAYATVDIELARDWMKERHDLRKVKKGSGV